MKTANALEVIVRDSGLDKTQSQIILEKFQTYFQIAAEWEAKARAIVVTDASQVADMKMARTGRLFLREKRIAVEKARKTLKARALAEGKAIDGIANVLKGLIEPIETYLDQQEHFVEIRAKARADQERMDAERKAEEERVAKEKAEAEEQARVKAENEKLKAEAAERERVARQEREAIEAKAAEEKKAQAAKFAAERKAAEEQAAKERKAAEAKATAERKEKERLAKELKNKITCPFCHRTFERGSQ